MDIPADLSLRWSHKLLRTYFKLQDRAKWRSFITKRADDYTPTDFKAEEKRKERKAKAKRPISESYSELTSSICNRQFRANRHWTNQSSKNI